MAPEENRGCMEALQAAGRIIMENGGETYRVEETVCLMGEGAGLSDVDCFAVPSGLFISYRLPDGDLQTGVLRVRRRGTDLSRVDAVNSVSRSVAAGEMTLPEALERLREIDASSGPVRGVWTMLAAFVCAGGFSLLFGGGWRELLLSGAVAAAVQGMFLLCSLARVQWIASTIAGGFFTALLSHYAAVWLPGISQEAVVAGALMPMVPGLAMTSAVQDTLQGDMVSGLSHGTQAILTACLIAGGALLAAAFIRLLEGGAL